jgi:hypothetical protein
MNTEGLIKNGMEYTVECVSYVFTLYSPIMPDFP